MVFPIRRMLVISLSAMVVVSLSAADKPLNIEKSYRASIASYWKSDAQYYQIKNFKKEVVLENTDLYHVLLVSYIVTIKQGNNYVSKRNKEALENIPQGFKRELLVFKKVAGKWKIVDESSKKNQHNRYSKPDYTVRLIVHSGFWQVKFLDGKYNKYTAYSVPNADPKEIRHPKRAREIYSAVSVGELPPPCSNSAQTKKIRITQYKKQLPIVLPEATSIRLLVLSEHLLYGVEMVKPRKQASGTPGYIYPVTIKANSPRTYHVYYYRNCGKDVEYGILPIKIVSKAEFERKFQKSSAATH